MSSVNNNIEVGWNEIVNRAYDKIPISEKHLFDGIFNNTVKSATVNLNHWVVTCLKRTFERLDSNDPRALQKYASEMAQLKILVSAQVFPHKSKEWHKQMIASRSVYMDEYEDAAIFGLSINDYVKLVTGDSGTIVVSKAAFLPIQPTLPASNVPRFTPAPPSAPKPPTHPTYQRPQALTAAPHGPNPAPAPQASVGPNPLKLPPIASAAAKLNASAQLTPLSIPEESYKIPIETTLPEEDVSKEMTDFEMLKQIRYDLKMSYTFVTQKRSFTEQAKKNLIQLIERYKPCIENYKSLDKRNLYHESAIKYFKLLKNVMGNKGILK